MTKNELRQVLQSTLKELDGLLKQIHETKEYTESNEYLACLRELVSEQIEVAGNEDTVHSAHQIR